MTQHEWFLVGLVCLGVALGTSAAWFTTGRSRAFRKRLLNDLEEAGALQGGIEKRLKEIVGNRQKWKKSVSLIRKPFSKHVNLAFETAAMIYALVGLINTMVSFQKYFDNPSQGYGILIFLSLVLGYIPSEHLLSSRAEKEMDTMLDEMEEAVDLKRFDAFLNRARREWKQSLNSPE